MKQYYYIVIVILLGLFISACEEDNNPVDGGGGNGSIYVQTTPETGAQIWIDGQNTNKVTPDSVTGLSLGNHTLTLKLSEYRDTTLTVNVTSTQRSITVGLTSGHQFVSYTDTLWETSGTTAAQPSGLDLSTGVAVSVGNASHDVFYSSNGYIITTSTSRSTVFNVGNDDDLGDGVNSPLALNAGQGGWTTSVSDVPGNYFFIYDADGHYSKMRVVSQTGGQPGNPSRVIVEWRYNSLVNDNTF